MTFVPDPEKIQRYPFGRRPYVEFDTPEGRVHASVIGWQGHMVLVEYPPQLITKFTHGQRVVEWLDRSQAVRIRREDSIWALVEDDVKWHDSQDQAISKRPDPWNIYKQEFPDGGMNHGSV